MTEMTSVWGHGQLLAFSGLDGETSYATGLCVRTTGPGTAFRVMLPGEAVITCDKNPPTDVDLAGDYFELTVAAGSVRGVLLDAWHLLLEGPASIAAEDERLQVSSDGDRHLISVADHTQISFLHADIDAAIAARRWWVASHAHRLGFADRPAAVKALRQMKTQVYSPEGLFTLRWTTPDRWPHRNTWLWDSAFHAIGLRHVEPQLAREAIMALLSIQHPNGMIPISSGPQGAGKAVFTQPPTLVLAAWAVSQVAPDPAWLRGLLPRLECYLDWDLRERNGGSGLPYWMIEGGINCRSGESGLDNSSRFDAASRMEAVDFASFLSLEYELAGRLWLQLGEIARAEVCTDRHLALNALIRERLWDDQTGLFRDFDLESNRFCSVAAITGFLPLICGAATPEQVARLVGLVRDPDMFGTAVPLPSVARSDASYEPDMWRGPVWINMAWLIAAGFARYGELALANELRSAVVGTIERWHGTHGTFFEFYDADDRIAPDHLKRKGRLAPEISPYHQCFHDYGWTATLYLDIIAASMEPLPKLP